MVMRRATGPEGVVGSLPPPAQAATASARVATTAVARRRRGRDRVGRTGSVDGRPSMVNLMASPQRAWVQEPVVVRGDATIATLCAVSRFRRRLVTFMNIDHV